MDLETMKRTIEQWPKNHQLEILKIIKQNTSTINENKSGIYVNMSFLTDKTLDEMRGYINYVKDQETLLSPLENQMEGFKSSFFSNKENM